jgi:hypothetical protein
MTVLYNELNFTCGREIALQDELLKLYRENKLTRLAKTYFGGLKRVGFNPSSGCVWLENDDCHTLMVNPDNGELDLFISTPYSGIEGFLSDILEENDLDDLHEEDKAYLLELKENA